MMGFYTFAYSLLILPTAAVYIDPATTSYLIQIIVGVVIAIGTGNGIFRSKIKKAFKRKNKEETVEAIEKKDTEGKDCVTAEDLLGDDANGEEG